LGWFREYLAMPFSSIPGAWARHVDPMLRRMQRMLRGHPIPAA
jgi:hypothetical protein